MKISLYLIAGALAISVASAQPVASNIGTKTLYTAPTIKLTPPPAGYEPAFVNHVGRHGARHLTKLVNTAKGYQLLEKAMAANGLTITGKRLFALIKKLDTLEQKDVKSISIEGVEEQQGIASRMYQQNKALFQNRTGAWQATITKEVRTKQTATAFINELKKQTLNKDDIDYTVNDTTLRFYDLAPAYHQFEDSGSWVESVAQIRQKWKYSTTINNFCKSIFSSAYLQQLSASQKEELVTDVYGFYTILFSLKKEAINTGIKISADSLKPFFTAQQFNVLGIADRAEDYFVKGPGLNNSGIQIKIAAPLLADFINTTDSFITTGKAPVHLRFSHAETIIPFAALLQISSAAKTVKNPTAFNDAVWNAGKVAPLSSNIQWILYKRKATDKYLVKFLLNEREVSITGMQTSTFPYYDWQEVKAFYLNKLQQLQLLVSGNGYQYLQGLK